MSHVAGTSIFHSHLSNLWRKKTKKNINKTVHRGLDKVQLNSQTRLNKTLDLMGPHQYSPKRDNNCCFY